MTIAPPDGIPALRGSFTGSGHGFESDEDENAVHGSSNASGSLVCMSPAPKYDMHHPGPLCFLFHNSAVPSFVL